ncbi:O-methyltransferase [Rhynchospora pubera]|uniref:O-methyltransferase n=1 Tax=Rhynchospora pubera TaxID=906938 RepID=A0AAV8AUP4_9POAL|nr:O-methyltransferase [Rhynchospora pubera]
MESKEYKAVPALLNMVFGFIKPMSLICALDLGIADQISSHGQPMTLSQLRSALSIPQSKEPYLRHLLRMLTHFGFIQVQTSDVVAEAQPIYDLTSMSRLVISKQASLNFVPFIRCHLQDLKDALQKSFLCMGDWLKQEDKETPFDMANNCSLWEMTSQNSRLNESFNSAMFILHDWSDEACLDILKKCKEAIRSAENGGKVIIVDAVVGSPIEYEETQLLFDMLMLTVHAGAERDEHEWKSLFTKAGFSSYRIVRTVGYVSIIEVYP